MISVPLLKRDLKLGLKPFLIVFAVILMYTLVIIYMYDPKLADMLDSFQEAMPGVMAAMGMTGIAANLLEWIQIYLYGFIMLMFPLLFILILTVRLLMGDIDKGSLANLLATPNSRGTIVRTQCLALLILLAALMAAVTGAGILASEAMFPSQLDIGRYVALNASTFLMQAAVAGIVFLVACVASESKQFYLVGAGLPILFYLLQMAGGMGGKLEALKYATLYTLLPAADIVAGNGGVWVQNLVLALIASACFAAGSAWFCRRDLAV